ncbi:MAG: sulfurtransferase, partial [Dehalococcoidia bacterium]|nr:sulfurtransferase [Dehalococcoidia bacterium]
QGAGNALETGFPANKLAGIETAEAAVKTVSAQDLDSNQPDLVIFVDTSEDFSKGHTPGAKWITRSWLEVEIAEAAPSKDTSIAVTCRDGRGSKLAAATLQNMGYSNVTALEGGLAAWRQAGMTVEEGLTGIIRPPSDINYLGVSRSYGEMMNYLRWETALGEKYATD